MNPGSWRQGSGRQARAHVAIGLSCLSTFRKNTSLCSGCHDPRLSPVSFEKCQPVFSWLVHRRKLLVRTQLHNNPLSILLLAGMNHHLRRPLFLKHCLVFSEANVTLSGSLARACTI